MRAFDMLCDSLSSIQHSIDALKKDVRVCQNNLILNECGKGGFIDAQLLGCPENWQICRKLNDPTEREERAEAIIFYFTSRSFPEPLWLWDWSDMGKFHPVMEGLEVQGFNYLAECEWETTKRSFHFVKEELTQRLMDVEKDPRLEGCLYIDGVGFLLWSHPSKHDQPKGIRIDSWIEIYTRLVHILTNNKVQAFSVDMYTLSRKAARLYGAYVSRASQMSRKAIKEVEDLIEQFGSGAHFYGYCKDHAYFGWDNSGFESWLSRFKGYP